MRFTFSMSMVVWTAAALAAAVALAPCSSAAPPVSDRLASGEFGPALQSLDGAPKGDLARRSAEVAAAQRRVGADLAAAATLHQVSGQGFRGQDSLGSIAGDPAAAALRTAPHLIGRPGGSQADFDTLIDLIVTTVSPLTWEEVGGQGSIREYPSGVYVDAQGLMVRRGGQAGAAPRLAELQPSTSQRPIRASSPRRIVSLRGLDAALALRLSLGIPPDEAMRNLAGLRRLEFVVFDREARDLLLVGPAGGWTIAEDARWVSTVDRRAVLQLDDLAMLLRRAMRGPSEPFGCSIEPTEPGLRRLQEYVAASQSRPLPAGGRRSWARRLRAELGPQDVHVFGIDAGSRAARTIVEADYDMKLIGMGLEAVDGVSSYLDLAAEQATPPPMEVLRWWFVLDHEIVVSQDSNAFELTGQGVKLLSENEFLTQTGRRQPTGATSALNRKFAEGFTSKYEEIAAQRPVYSDLQNVFGLAVAMHLASRHETWGDLCDALVVLDSPYFFPLHQGAAPRRVESVVGVQSVRRGLLVAGVSGGVTAEPAALPRAPADDSGVLANVAEAAATDDSPRLRSRWWWDAPR